ncbi:MAG: restriction endonuclease [Mesorhizobium sp.]|uniref:restriction endonuclease n=1 Tax=Mesorhizobium sp. TaxID=1871066 RepID=UPI0011FC2DEC|nr:restriction endonuclease [Mesorhizobium sp.]TIR28291.1 MAG: restriction endonuclease [Mesorhizobium sp.]TIS21333.1 MAG: restriction endonuclease [Mesorhizobium sp.]
MFKAIDGLREHVEITNTTMENAVGGIWGSRQYFIDALTEIAGYKAGVVLTEVELYEILRDQDDIARILDPDGQGGGRLHSSVVEEAVVTLLHRLGNTPSDRNIPITIEMFHKYRRTDNKKIYSDLMDAFVRFCKSDNKVTENREIDPSSLMSEMFERHGSIGGEMALELIKGINRDMHRSAWTSIRNIEWRDTVELDGLFKSAGLETMHAKFFDQRYVDYLSQNFDKVDDMHWRKFEGFTAEFFEREGFHVRLGPGSNDDGVDLRVYPSDADPTQPPMILVQCKRQKAKIEKALIKSVYADVLHEKASSGLIVTTSTLSPGAEATRTARSYPIEAADRATLRTWIDQLRS